MKTPTVQGQMKTKLLKDRKGLIAVITLILLVVSILLALIATLYAMSIVDNGPPKELPRVHKQHIWYNSAGNWFELGLAVTNNGGTDVFLDKITVQGGLCGWDNTYYYKNVNLGLSKELNVTRNELPDTQYADLSSVFKYGDGNFTRASHGVTSKSDWTIVLYIKNPPAYT